MYHFPQIYQKSLRWAVVWQVFAVISVLSQQAPFNPGAPITLHPLKPGEPRPMGVWLSGPARFNTIFLVTNHTDKTIVASLSAVEVKTGSNWITQLRPHGSLMLSATNSIRMPGATNTFFPGLSTMELGPHQVAYSTIEFSGGPVAGGPTTGSPVGCGMNYLAGLPTGAVWRLTVS